MTKERICKHCKKKESTHKHNADCLTFAPIQRVRVWTKSRRLAFSGSEAAFEIWKRGHRMPPGALTERGNFSEPQGGGRAPLTGRIDTGEGGGGKGAMLTSRQACHSARVGHHCG